MILRQPVTGIGDHEVAYVLTVRAVVVDPLTPRRHVPIGKVVGREGAQIVSIRPEMVVDHIQEHAQSLGVCRVNKALQVIWPAIDVAGGIEIDPVISPVPAPWTLRYGHQFQCRDTQGLQFWELLGQSGVGAFRRIGPYVTLVDHQSGRRQSFPRTVRPFIRAGIDHLGRAVGPVGLEPGPGIGIAVTTVQFEPIPRPRPCLRDEPGVHTVIMAL